MNRRVNGHAKDAEMEIFEIDFVTNGVETTIRLPIADAFRLYADMGEALDNPISGELTTVLGFLSRAVDLLGDVDVFGRNAPVALPTDWRIKRLRLLTDITLHYRGKND